MSILYGALVPHAPILLPEIGGQRRDEVRETISALENNLVSELEEVEPELLVLVTPHGPVNSSRLTLFQGQRIEGSLVQFGFPQLKIEYPLAVDFIQQLIDSCGDDYLRVLREGDPQFTLDHGALVPLYFLQQAGLKLPLVLLSMGLMEYEKLFSFGKRIAMLSEREGVKLALMASGDLSHRLTPEAPAGYNPEGSRFDQRVVEVLGESDYRALLDLDQNLIKRAGECGLRPLMVMLGGVEQEALRGRVFSYQGPFGVGYAVAGFKKRDERGELCLSLARRTVESFALEGEVPDCEPEGPLQERRGVFVSIKKKGKLRGCVGTFEPTKENLAEEIITNAISAAFRDPRFPPVEADELNELSFSVDLIGDMESVTEAEELDPQKYGVLVQRGSRKGLLLPDLEGINTVEEQLTVAKRKAGLSPQDQVQIRCFRVERYRE